VNQDNRLARTVVLIIEIDVAGVFFPDGDEWHDRVLLPALKHGLWELDPPAPSEFPGFSIIF
jgi:hypothetical protein